MKFAKRLKSLKKCPRCGNKCLRQQETCEECGLIFARLEYASNKAAKKKIRHFDKDFVIYTNQFPKDVSWLKLILLTFFTGLVGGHYYYVGKYWKGALMSLGFTYLIFCTIFNAQMVAYLEATYAYLPIGVLGFSWLASIIYVACKKFKVPVIVEVPQEFVEKRKEFLDSIPSTKKKDKEEDLVVEAKAVEVEKKPKKRKSKKVISEKQIPEEENSQPTEKDEEVKK